MQAAAIADAISAYTFKPSTQLERIMERTALTERGRFFMKASRATIADGGTFRSTCSMGHTEKTVILGCYRANLIYVYDVENEQLDGIEEVTAVHEMLHAVYARLNDTEKRRVDAMLQAAYQAINDLQLTSLMGEYEKMSPREINNELHSILATQVAELPDELEAYYAQYLVDRSIVTNLFNGYEQVFRSLKTRQDTLVSELDALAEKINNDRASYERDLEQINADISAFNVRARSGSLSAVAYNNGKASLQERLDTLERLRLTLNEEIDTYNQKKKELDAVNLEADTLNKSIDSSIIDPARGIPAL